MFNDSELVKVNPTSIVFDNINRMLYEFAVSFEFALCLVEIQS